MSGIWRYPWSWGARLQLFGIAHPTRGGGGATTTIPGATPLPPQAICQNLRWEGGQLGPGGGGRREGRYRGIGSSARVGGLRATHYYHMHTSRVCVCVSGGMGKNYIKEGKGRLKSWTLCDGLGEGFKGLGLAVRPPPPRPPPNPGAAARWKDWALGVKCLPPLPPSHGRGAGSQNALWVPARRLSPVKPPPHCHCRCPPPTALGQGSAYRRPAQTACTSAHPPLLTPAEGAPRGAWRAMPHPPVPPA